MTSPISIAKNSELFHAFEELAERVSGDADWWRKLPTYEEYENIPIANNLEDLEFLNTYSGEAKSQLLVFHAVSLAERVWKATRPSNLENPGLIITYWTSDIREFGFLWPLITFLPDQTDLIRTSGPESKTPEIVGLVEKWTTIQQATLEFQVMWSNDGDDYCITSIAQQP